MNTFRSIMKRLLFIAFSIVALSIFSSCARRMPCPAYTQNSTEKKTNQEALAYLSEGDINYSYMGI
jgi:hypothetical protein